MKLRAKAAVSLSSLAFFSLILVAAMGWVVALTQLRGQHDGITRALIEIGEEVLKVAVIAASAAIMIVYEHCPFAFVFATETQVFVEQYDYREQSKPAAMPLINFQSGTDQYREQMFSLDVIWNNAQEAALFDEVGTAVAIREARAKNIYRGRYRSHLSQNQTKAIKGAKEGSIDILVISGRFYISDRDVAPEIRRVSLSKKSPTGEVVHPGVPIRFALINPVSQQAILRAVAEGCLPEQVGEMLRTWNWTSHQNSSLYRDTLNTANILSIWIKEQGCDIKVRAYSSSIACAILRTDNQAFVEQYIYGRSKSFQRGLNLGGEYPVIEYDISRNSAAETVEQQVIEASFEMIWKFYSTPWGEFLNCNQEQIFAQNLDMIRKELGVLQPRSLDGDRTSSDG